MAVTARLPIERTRRGIKVAVFVVSLIVAAPLIALVWLEKRLSRSEALFGLCGQLLAICPGFPGCWLRGAYYYGTLDRCSWETRIGFGSLFMHRGAEVGSRVSTGAYCVIGHARIGDNAMIGSRVSIPSGKRQHFDDRGRLTDKTHFDHVWIGANCWIGEGAIIMANIGDQCVVSAGAVVTKDAAGDCLIGGNPARVIRELEADTSVTAVKD